MRYALISDIHGNLEALQAVLCDIESRNVDEVACLGDVLGYGCDPKGCLDLIGKTCKIKLIGNHEYALLGLIGSDNMNEMAKASIKWTSQQLTDKELSLLDQFTMNAQVDNAFLVHASPFEPDRWRYVLTAEDAAIAFDHFDQQLCFVGHTHLPMFFSRGLQDSTVRERVGHDFDPDEESRYLVNVGSVGQPRDKDPRSCYVIYDADEMAISYHRVEYDIKTAQKKMVRAKMPELLVERLELGR